MSEDDLMTKVRGNIVVTDDCLTQCIADIRRAIADSDHKITRTLPKKGDMLTTDTSGKTVGPAQAKSPDIASVIVLPFQDYSEE